MARTIDEIVGEINGEANKHEALSDIQSNTSRVSVWGFLKRSVAFCVLTMEKMMEKHMAEVRTLVSQQEAGTLEWYVQKARAFQYGDRISVVGNRLEYLSKDKSKQIIKQVSIKESTSYRTAGTLHIKALKEEQGTLTPLAQAEKDALLVYLNKIKFAGIRISVTSVPADSIRLDLQLEVNHELIDRLGMSTSNPSVSPVEEAIKHYFNRLPFDGILYFSKLEDQMQAVEGVLNVRIVSVHSRILNGDYVPVESKYESHAGYLTLDEENSVITYR